MQITLQQTDIEQAIRNYVTEMGISRDVSEIVFSHARKGGGNTTADITIAPLGVTATSPTTIVKEEDSKKSHPDVVNNEETEVEEESASIFG